MVFVLLYLFVRFNRDFYGRYSIKKPMRSFSFFVFGLRKLHGRAIRTYQETDSHENQDDLSVKSVDLVIEVDDHDQPSTYVNGRDRKLYLKSLERSLRTGRRIQDDNNNCDDEQITNSKCSMKYFRQCFNKHIRNEPIDV